MCINDSSGLYLGHYLPYINFIRQIKYGTTQVVHVHESHGYTLCTQLQEIWVENSADASDPKIRDECQPGKPISVFSSTAYKVRKSRDGTWNGETPRIVLLTYRTPALAVSLSSLSPPPLPLALGPDDSGESSALRPVLHHSDPVL